MFEDLVAARLPELMRPMGAVVEACGGTPGAKARKHGDYAITLDPASTRGETVRVAVEAKSQAGRFSADRIRQELAAARANREAAAGLFIAESTEMLPNGQCFGQVGQTDFFVVLDPTTGDETALTCALYLARAAALATVATQSGGNIDVDAAMKEVSGVRDLLERFGKLDASHSKIEREVGTSRTIADDLKAQILDRLRRLDSILTT